MKIARAFALFLIFAFSACLAASAFLAAPASANKMDGKPGHDTGSANYSKPPAKTKTKKPATSQ